MLETPRRIAGPAFAAAGLAIVLATGTTPAVASAKSGTAWGTRGDIPVPADYDGDGRAERAVFRPSNGTWYVQGLGTARFGTSGDRPMAYDRDIDGRAELIVFRPSTGRWYEYGSRYGSEQWGQSGDVPVMGLYGNDPSYFEGVYRPGNSTWYIDGWASVPYGAAGDIPVPADYGDCRLAACTGVGVLSGEPSAWDLAVFRPSSGTWYVRGVKTVQFGRRGDIPVPGNYIHTGGNYSYARADAAVFRPANGTWYMRGRGSVRYGTAGDIPVPADYTGDGRAEIAVFRPSTGTWYGAG